MYFARSLTIIKHYHMCALYQIRNYLGEDLFGYAMAYLAAASFFLCFPHLCIRSHLTGSWFSEILNKDYWTVETDSINTMVSPILYVALWIFIKKTPSVLFFMDYFINILLSWVISSHCSLFPWKPLSGREESLWICVLPSQSSVKGRTGEIKPPS